MYSFYTDATRDASAISTSLVSVCDEAGGSTSKAVSLLYGYLRLTVDVKWTSVHFYFRVWSVFWQSFSLVLLFI